MDIFDGEDNEDFEIEIADEDDSIFDLFDDDETFEDEFEYDHYENLVTELSDEDLSDIASQVVIDFDRDLSSRRDWEDMVIAGLDSLGVEEGAADSTPIEGGCTINHPIILESVISYQSKTAKELLPAKGPARTQILGTPTIESEKRASRVKKFLNYQLTEQMPEFRSETERLLFFVPLIGTGFKRMTWNVVPKRPENEYLSAADVVVNASASSLLTADRISVRSRPSKIDMRRLFASGYYEEPDEFPDEPTTTATEDNEFEQRLREIIGIDVSEDPCYDIIEQQCYLQINEEYMQLDEEAEYRPYIVTLERSSQKIVSLRRDYAEFDSTYTRQQHIVQYSFVPNGNFYAFGFVHLLGNIQKTLTLTLRSLQDAGQFANMQGGFKKKGFKMHKGTDNTPIMPGEFRDVEFTGDDINHAIMALPYKEPSQVLAMLHEKLENRAQRFADSTDAVVADSTNYGPVGTTMALLEASAKFFNAIHARGYESQKQELRILSRLNYEFLDDMVNVNMVNETFSISRDDFDPKFIQVVPVTDPNVPSQAQRLAMAETKLARAMQLPQYHNMPEVLREFYAALDVDDIDNILVKPDEAQELDPVSDLIAVTQNKPIKAFPGQDHESHMMVKGAWLQNPMAGGSPTMQQFAPIVAANIREHQMLLWKTQMDAMQQEQGFDVATASQELAQLMQVKQEQESEGTPAHMIAQAETMRANTEAQKEERQRMENQTELALRMLETVAKLEKEANNAAKTGVELQQKEREMGYKMLADGMKSAERFQDSVDKQFAGV